MNSLDCANLNKIGAVVQDPTSNPIWTGEQKALADTGRVAKMKSKYEGGWFQPLQENTGRS